MPAVLQIHVSKNLYLRDPEETELGRQIVSESIKLIDKIGFEKFTFKKLAAEISSTEASVYRYFESKHQLLLYLVSWYWLWIEYRIQYRVSNIKDHTERLKIVVLTLTESTADDPASTHVDEEILHRIVVAESAKAYLAPEMRTPKSDELFRAYQSLIDRISGIIHEAKPKYTTPRALASSLVVLAHRQSFYAKFIPTVTDLKVKKDSYKDIIDFLDGVLLSTLEMK